MSNPAKQIVLGAALLVGITMVTNADPLPGTGNKSTASGASMPSGARQLSGNEASALPPSDAKPTRDSTKLPGVSVVAPPYSHPYTSRIGPKVSPNGRLRTEHYQAPPDYVTNIAMHPYASGVGPKAGPNGKVRAEHYQAPVDYVTNIAMHPYTSGVGLKAGPNRVLRFEHFQVTPDYVADVSKHPYTSGFGVPPEGGRNRPGDLQGVKRLNDKALPGTGG